VVDLSRKGLNVASKKKVGFAPDVQPHIQRARMEFKAFIDANGMSADEAEITLESGLLVINLPRVLTFAEMRDLSYLFAADPEVTRAKHTKTEAKIKAEKGESYVEAEERTKFGAFSILAKTSKMGAYSFNLPAGPTGATSLGTCPVSAIHWPDPKNRRDVFVNELGSEVIKGRGDDDWICGNCYAMKGAYGSPSAIMIQELRRQWVMSFANKRGGSGLLATWLTRAIRWAQIKSIKSVASLRGKLDQIGQDRSVMVPDPEYFRIHDAGDFGLGPWYTNAWFETCRRCSEPKVFRLPKTGLGKLGTEFIDGDGSPNGVEFVLPAVNFWAATRAWTVTSGLESFVGDKCEDATDGTPLCVPKNLTIRPSALYFRDAAPSLNGKRLRVLDERGEIIVGGYAAGTTGDALENVKDSKSWSCPAYTPTDPKRPKASQPGACQKSVGHDPKVDVPAPAGHGCRTCWSRPDVDVLYIRH
jgi:hypothetical protein